MSYDGFNLDGRVALVSGGTSGLGRAIAGAFARSGAQVVVASRDAAKVGEAARELAGLGEGHGGLQLDVASQSSVEQVVAQVVEQWGGLDILVNAAGITVKVPSLDLALEDW